MKRIARIILVLVLVTSMIFTAVGCGGKEPASSDANDDFFADSENIIDTGSEDANSNNSGDGSGQGETTQNPSNNVNSVGGKTWAEVLANMPKNLKGTTIDFYNWNPQSEYGGVSTVLRNFEKETGIKVNWITMNYSVYQTKLAALVASDEAPDVARTNTPVSYNMQSFQPLDATKFDFSDAAWDKVLMKDYTINGKQYATNLNNTHLAGYEVMFYNKSLLDKYDMENPYQLWKDGKWTWNKFLDMCKEFKKESNADYAAGALGWGSYTQLFGVNGPMKYDGTKYVSMLDDSNFLRVTQEVADLHNTDKLFLEWGLEEFDAGKILFWGGGAIHGRRLNAYFSNLKNSGAVYSVPMPSIDGQEKYYQGVFEYEAYAVVKGAKNPEAVPYFLRYFLDPANYDMGAFFINNQMKEVYDWCAKQTNKIWTMGYFDRINRYDFDGIRSMKGNQVISFVDSHEYAVTQRVNEMNDALEKLK